MAIQDLLFHRTRAEQYREPGSGETPHVEEHVLEGLANVRPGGPPGPLHLRWNLRGAGYVTGYDVLGKPQIRWEPRWELWDWDADGLRYMFTRLQDEEGNPKQPGEWLVETMNRLKQLHENYNGDYTQLHEELVHLANAAQDNLDMKNYEEMVYHAAREWWRGERTTVGPHTTFHGKRALSA